MLGLLVDHPSDGMFNIQQSIESLVLLHYNVVEKITLYSGSLGSGVDEERSQLRVGM